MTVVHRQTFSRVRVPSRPIGPEDQNRDQNHEHQRAGPALADVGRAERSSQADHQPAEHRAGNVADAAEHGRREGVQAVLKSHLVADRVDVQAIDHDGRAGQCAADGERDGDHAIDVDAHQRGGDGVLSRGPHGLCPGGCLSRTAVSAIMIGTVMPIDHQIFVA